MPIPKAPVMRCIDATKFDFSMSFLSNVKLENGGKQLLTSSKETCDGGTGWS